MKALCDGIAFPLPAGTWVSLHVADSSETGGSEVSLTNWPAYVRRAAEQGGAIGTGWTATANGERKNTKQLTYPSHNGIPDVTVTHWACWDALNGGNMLFGAPLETPRLLKTGDILVFDINALTARQS